MLLIKNPTDVVVSFTLRGVEYSVEAKGELPVLAEVAEAWIKIHQFLKVHELPRVAEKVVKEVEEKVEKVISSKK